MKKIKYIIFPFGLLALSIALFIKFIWFSDGNIQLSFWTFYSFAMTIISLCEAESKLAD